MIRRVLDLTQTIRPSNTYQRNYPPPWSDFEITGPERTRVDLQHMVNAEAFHLDGHLDELMMHVTIGHSTGHTHVDCFLQDWECMYQDVPREMLWARRDISQVPSHELLGPAAVVDISEEAPFGKITLSFFKEKAAHVRHGDIVLIKSGHPSLVKAGKYLNDEFSVIGADCIHWLATEKQVRVCGFDHKINMNFPVWSRSERACYRHGVLMIDKIANLDTLESGARYFSCVGLSFKVQGVDDSPARVFVIDKLSDITEGGKTHDLFFPIQCPWDTNAFPFARSEPYEKKHQIMNRFNLENCHMIQDEYPDADVFGGPGFMAFKTFSSHIGTHLQVPTFPMVGLEAMPVYDLSRIATDRLWGKCVIVDAWAAGPCQDVTAAMLERAKGRITEDTIVLVRTAYSDYYAKHPDYLKYSPGFTDEAIRWLCDKKIKMLVTDFATVERASANCCIGVHNHLKSLFSNGILVVNNAYSMWRLTRPESVAFVSPMAFPHLNASPCRVQVYEEYNK